MDLGSSRVIDKEAGVEHLYKLLTVKAITVALLTEKSAHMLLQQMPLQIQVGIPLVHCSLCFLPLASLSCCSLLVLVNAKAKNKGRCFASSRGCVRPRGREVPLDTSRVLPPRRFN